MAVRRIDLTRCSDLGQIVHSTRRHRSTPKVIPRIAGIPRIIRDRRTNETPHGGTMRTDIRVSSLLISPPIEDALRVPSARRKVRLSMQAGTASAARGCFPQVVLKVARIPVGNLNFGRSSGRACVCAGVCWPKVVRSPMRRNGLWEPISPGYGSRGITTAAALFHPFPYYSRPRASSIICGAGIGRARRAYLRPLVPLDRPKSHEISMRNPY